MGSQILETLRDQIASVAAPMNLRISTLYEEALSQAEDVRFILGDIEDILAGGIPDNCADGAGMGRPPTKSKPARSRSTPAAKSSVAKAITPATAKPGKATKPSLAKTSPKSRVGSKDRQNKKGKTRR